MAEKGLVGNTGNKVSFFEEGDTDWGLSTNKAIENIAKNIDDFYYGALDVDREVTVAAGKRFQELRETLQTLVETYTATIDSEKEISIERLSTYINDRLDEAVNDFVETSAKDLAATQMMKGLLQNQLRYIEDSISNLKTDFDNNLSDLSDEIKLATESRDETYETIDSQITTAEEVLTSHIENVENPHRTTADNLEKAAVVYQPDPDNTNQLLEPAATNLADITTIAAEDPSSGYDDPSFFSEKVLGVGEFSSTLGDTASVGAHYYLEFDEVTPSSSSSSSGGAGGIQYNTLTDSAGDTARWFIEAGTLTILWDAGTTKVGYQWDVGIIGALNRLDTLSINIKSVESGESFTRSIFVLYLSTAAYPDMLAYIMGLETQKMYIYNGADADLNWSIDIDDTPAEWYTIDNPNQATPDYWIQFLDVVPDVGDQLVLEGPYPEEISRWKTSAESIDTASFSNVDLSTYGWWALDSNGNYIYVKYSTDKITFIHDMFERGSTSSPSSSSSGGDGYTDIATESYAMGVSWTFTEDWIADPRGKNIDVTNNRMRVQTGGFEAGTSGAFTIQKAARYEGN